MMALEIEAELANLEIQRRHKADLDDTVWGLCEHLCLMHP